MMKTKAKTQRPTKKEVETLKMTMEHERERAEKLSKELTRVRVEWTALLEENNKLRTENDKMKGVSAVREQPIKDMAGTKPDRTKEALKLYEGTGTKSVEESIAIVGRVSKILGTSFGELLNGTHSSPKGLIVELLEAAEGAKAVAETAWTSKEKLVNEVTELLARAARPKQRGPELHGPEARHNVCWRPWSEHTPLTVCPPTSCPCQVGWCGDCVICRSEEFCGTCHRKRMGRATP